MTIHNWRSRKTRLLAQQSQLSQNVPLGPLIQYTFCTLSFVWKKVSKLFLINVSNLSFVVSTNNSHNCIVLLIRPGGMVLKLLVGTSSLKAINGQNYTGKSFSEILILTSTNPQYDKRLFIELPVQYMKIPSSEHGENIGRTWVEHVVHISVLSLEFSCTELVIQWTIFCHIVG